MERDIAPDSGDAGLDVASMDAGLTGVWERCERAVDELGGSVPASQLRALVIADRSGTLSLGRLARTLGMSVSAARKLCDAMEAGGLLAYERAAVSHRETVLLVTESGRRLAGWVRDRRHALLAQGLESMSPDGRQALARGLRELAAAFG